jgi:hypothetical protein
MTDHRRWLELAATAPAFLPTPGDADGLAAHLESCPACAHRAAGLRADFAAVGGLLDSGSHTGLRERVAEAAALEPAGLHPILLVGLLGLLLAAVLGATMTVGGALLGGDELLPAPAGLPDISGKAIVWETAVVHLGADRVELRVNGSVLSAATRAVKVGGDPGDLDRWTLEVAWQDAGLQLWLSLYFKSDGATWWIDEVRASDAAGAGTKWATFPRGRLAVTPLGQAFRGDLTASGFGPKRQIDLTMRGVVLSVTPRPAFVAPAGAGQGVAADVAKLRCSGILQLPPRLAEQELRGFKISWRWQYRTGPDEGVAEVRVAAPQLGYISGAEIGTNGELIVFVEDPNRPLLPPAAVPADCPNPASP